MPAPSARYRGRFAPTPSGPLHLGSLLTAVGSWLSARQADGQWLLRIDDLDRPRCVSGAEAEILRQLEAHGLHWDEPPLRQSEHLPRYESALQQLLERGDLYACTCSRAQLQAMSASAPDGPVYAGTCRERGHPLAGAALRLRVPDREVAWRDGVQGPTHRDLRRDCGDFAVRRSDGVIGYHLACSADEEFMSITEVVRGADLLGSTAQQILLSETLGWSRPAYAHLPVLLAEDGRKLSKQNSATPLQCDIAAVERQLRACFAALSLPVAPAEVRNAGALLGWAIPHWQPSALAGRVALSITT